MTELGRAPEQKPWSAPLRFDDVPETGRHVNLHADEPTRAALATFADVRSVGSADASFDVVRQGRDGLRVTGEVRATVGQVCVVTLEPIESEILESIDVVFRPVAETPAAVGGDAGPAKASEDDPPEPLIEGVADLGMLAAEFLVLGIDPYPRKADATFSPPQPPAPPDSPFAALAKLKDRGESKK